MLGYHSDSISEPAVFGLTGVRQQGETRDMSMQSTRFSAQKVAQIRGIGKIFPKREVVKYLISLDIVK